MARPRDVIRRLQKQVSELERANDTLSKALGVASGDVVTLQVRVAELEAEKAVAHGVVYDLRDAIAEAERHSRCQQDIIGRNRETVKETTAHRDRLIEAGNMGADWVCDHIECVDDGGDKDEAAAIRAAYRNWREAVENKPKEENDA